MLTRSSTWRSAGSSVLKSKWVIESKYDSCPTFAPWKMVRNVSHGSYWPRAAQLISSPSDGARLMSRKYRRAIVCDGASPPNSLRIGLVVRHGDQSQLLT